MNGVILNTAGLVPTAVATGNDLDGGSSPSDVPGATCASLAPEKRLYGPASAPSDLLNFVRAYAVRDAVAALGLAVGTVHRLRQGYWPADPRKSMEAWSQYKAKRGMEVSSWFLRRVRVGGLVRHAGADYSAPLLAARYRLARQGSPLAGIEHLDLLFPTRRRYRGVWENCRLATIERRALGIVREDDLPGSEAPGAWLQYLRGGDACLLRRVLQHNFQDVVTLAHLLLHLAQPENRETDTQPPFARDTP